MAKKYQLTQDGPKVQALLNKIDGVRANQTPGQGVEPIQMENLSIDGVLYAFLTSAVSNLLNYYTKSETYSRTEVDALFAAIKQFTIQSVDALPQPPSADTMNILYLVPADEPKVANEKDEFITVIKDGSYAWEQVGSTAIDLSGYVTTEALNAVLATYATKTELQDIRQLKVLNLVDFYPQDGSVTLGTKSEAAAALNITEAQVDSLLNGEYDYIEFGAEFILFGGYKISLALPFESVYMCLGIGSHFVTMPYRLEFWNRNNAGVYSYNYAPIGIKDVTVGGESVIGSGSGVAAIPAIPDVSQFITKSVNDLVNYYLKSEVYTKDEVAALIGAIQQFHYEIAASTSSVTDPSNNVLYLIGPTGTGSDKYEEYVYSNGWVKIGDTSIDLSGYVTTQALNTALAGYVTSGALETALAGKQDKIDANHKLDYSLLENTPTIPAAQVPADWSATTGVSRILNKPTIPTQYAGSPTAGGFANKAVAIPFGSVDAGSTATEITATVDNFPTTLTDGVCAFIRNNVVASASGFTLNINGTGAKPVYQTLADASRVSTVFNADSTYLFIYNSTRVEGGCWDLYYGYNSNDNTIGYNLRTNGASAPPAAQKYYRYRLLFTAANGKSLVPANTSSSTSATAAKTVNQTKIDPFGVIFYYSYTSAVNAAASPNASYLWMQYNGIALGYSFNRTGEALEMTARDPVYLKCAPQSDGSAIIDADNPIVQALPTTADGKIYIFLGFAESATAITLYYWHPVYYHDGTSVRLWTGKEASGGGGSETKTLSLKGTSSAYFDKADVMNVVNDALFFFNMKMFTDIDPEFKIGTAIFVGSDSANTNFEIRHISGTNILTTIIIFKKNTTTGDVTSIVYDGNTYNYNSATDRYEMQTS